MTNPGWIDIQNCETLSSTTKIERWKDLAVWREVDLTCIEQESVYKICAAKRDRFSNDDIHFKILKFEITLICYFVITFKTFLAKKSFTIYGNWP